MSDRHRNQPETLVRGLEAPQPVQRILVMVAHANREMQRFPPVIKTRSPDDAGPTDPFSDSDRNLAQV